MRGTEGVLLDFDGTLIDSNHAHALAWQAYLSKKTRLDLPIGRVQSMMGMGGDKILAELFGDKFSDREMKTMSEERDELYMAEYWPRVQPIPGAAEFVGALYTKGYKVVLATSMSSALLELAYRMAPVESFIIGSASASEAEESKPAPDIFTVGIQKYGLDPTRTVAVGDSPYDLEAGRLAGCRATIAVRTGDYPDAMLSTATAIYDSVFHLLTDLDESPLGK